MIRSRNVVAAVIVVLVVIAVSGDPDGLAGQPLPTPRGQLGGHEPLEPTYPAGVVVAPGQAPLPAAVPVPAVGGLPSRSDRLSSMAIVAARSAMLVRSWRDGEASVAIGWTWDGRARVVTIAEAVERADRVEVSAAGTAWLDASLLGVDEASGIAVIVAPGLDAPPLDLPAATTEPGDRVAAVVPPGRGAVVARVAGSASAPDEDAGLIDVSPEGSAWPPGAPVVSDAGLVGMAAPTPGRSSPAKPERDANDFPVGEALAPGRAYVTIGRVNGVVSGIVARSPDGGADRATPSDR